MVSDTEGPAGTKQPLLHPIQVKRAPHLCVCVCPYVCVRQQVVTKGRMYFYKTKHVRMIAQYVILHSQTSSCYAQEGWGGNLIKHSGLKEL